jgi:hypothetical protein
MNGNKSDVKLKNERELRFYRWLYKNESALLNYQLKPFVNAISISYLYSLDIKRASRVINSAVRSFYHPDIANTFGRASRGHITESFIPSRDFAWFKMSGCLLLCLDCNKNNKYQNTSGCFYFS